MGNGYTLTCASCKNQLHVYEGVGMFYPQVCRDILQRMQQGAYGDALQKAALSHSNAAIHQEECLFQCMTCGRIQHGEVIDFCIPQYASGLPDHFCFVMKHDIGEGYRVIGSVPHPCPVCQSDMQPISADAHTLFPCPRCGGQLTITDWLKWD